jgi:hypothetical protein
MLEKLKAAWKEWRRKRKWNAELQLYHLRVQVMQDARWMAHDPKVSAMCARYMDMLEDDWEKRPVRNVSDFRLALGLDPNQPPAPKSADEQAPRKPFAWFVVDPEDQPYRGSGFTFDEPAPGTFSKVVPVFTEQTNNAK